MSRALAMLREAGAIAAGPEVRIASWSALAALAGDGGEVPEPTRERPASSSEAPRPARRTLCLIPGSDG